MEIVFMLDLLKNFIIAIPISVFLAYVAWEQLNTNRKKLKLDLYNKRFEIYLITLKYYQELMDLEPGEEVEKEIQRDFIRGKEAAYYLFSKTPEIYKLLLGITASSAQIVAFKKLRESEREALGKQELLNMYNVSNDSYKIISKSIKRIQILMADYLNQ